MNKALLARITGILAALVGGFLLLGAWGHLAAVWPSGLKVALPGVLLAAAGLLNLAYCRGLWRAQPDALRWTSLGTGLAFIWLLSLFINGVPGHPINTFTILVGSYLALLVLGLTLSPGQRNAAPQA